MGFGKDGFGKDGCCKGDGFISDLLFYGLLLWIVFSLFDSGCGFDKFGKGKFGKSL